MSDETTLTMDAHARELLIRLTAAESRADAAEQEARKRGCGLRQLHRRARLAEALAAADAEIARLRAAMQFIDEALDDGNHAEAARMSEECRRPLSSDGTP